MHIVDMTGAVAAKALDGLYLRQMAVAHNIANAGTDGFAPTRVDFESALRAVLPASGADPAAAAERVKALRFGSRVDHAQTVRIDMEVTAAAENAMRYAALMGALDRKLQVMSMAINQGAKR